MKFSFIFLLLFFATVSLFAKSKSNNFSNNAKLFSPKNNLLSAIYGLNVPVKNKTEVTQFIKFHAVSLGVNPKEMKLVDVTKLKNITVYTFSRRIDNILVYGETMHIIIKKGNINSLTMNMSSNKLAFPKKTVKIDTIIQNAHALIKTIGTPKIEKIFFKGVPCFKMVFPPLFSKGQLSGFTFFAKATTGQIIYIKNNVKR